MARSSTIKDQIKSRANWTMLGFALITILIFFQIFYLQNQRGEDLVKKIEKIESTEREIQAVRGNIYASDGISLLSTSVPKYQVAIDPKQARHELFYSSVDQLSRNLSSFFGDRTPAQYRKLLTDARLEKGRRFVLISNRYINYQERVEISKFPLFRDGPNLGGGIFVYSKNRFKPFKNLARRTVGDVDSDQKKGLYGIEKSFDKYLAGINGRGLYHRIAGQTWVPANSDSDVESETGDDVISTIDINFQDIVESELRKQVVSTQAQYGSAIVMEIKTGQIKAMANLTRKVKDGKVEYREVMNYAVQGGTDPGSTFKLPTMMAILEKTGLPLNTYVTTCQGAIKYKDLTMTCSHAHGPVNIQQVFEKSCNVGVFVLMRKYFGFSTGTDYVDYLRRFRLDKPLGFQIKGESAPIIYDKNSKYFSKTTIPWMAIGYETKLTPLQMLAFYNAIANNGVWVQPNIVTEIRRGDKVLEKFNPIVIGRPIVSNENVKKAKIMMQGVVLRGTAANVKVGKSTIAGKTGTSQKRTKNGYRKGRYYTAFIGFFPVNNPKYSCAIIIDEPVGTNLYASQVSAPVFRNIADKIFAYDISIHPSTKTFPENEILVSKRDVADKNDILNFSKEFSIVSKPINEGLNKVARMKKDSIQWIPKNQLDIVGLSLKDALPLLENKGYEISYSGFGKVKEFEIYNNKKIKLILN